MTFYGTTATGAGWIVPKKYVEHVGDEGFKKAPIGAGPYRLVRISSTARWPKTCAEPRVLSSWQCEPTERSSWTPSTSGIRSLRGRITE